MRKIITDDQETVTRLGNPAKPQGEEGRKMLIRMNSSHSGVTEWALSFLSFSENDRALDIGCGGGATVKRLSDRIPRGHIAGVDYSEISVEMSISTNADDIARGKTEIYLASVDNLPFDDNSFDKIVTVESFYFWPDPVKNLREVRRVLKPDGVFMMAADIYGKNGLSEQTLENVRRYALTNPTLDRFGEMFSEAGFTDIAIRIRRDTDWVCVEAKG
ncbi:MAG: methyltransferase domain-containing protein [Clostridia bacterium]|nr:methyltransferase domain-containing protein [Clostridia bacterium]